MNKNHKLLLAILLAAIILVVIANTSQARDHFVVGQKCVSNRECNGNPPSYNSRTNKNIAEKCDIKCYVKNNKSVCDTQGLCIINNRS
jgi:hypothetical protein